MTSMSVDEMFSSIFHGEEGFEALIKSMDGNTAIEVFNLALRWICENAHKDTYGNYDVGSGAKKRIRLLTKHIQETGCDIMNIDADAYYQLIFFDDIIDYSLKSRLDDNLFSDGRHLLRAIRAKNPDRMLHVRYSIKDVSKISDDVKLQLVDVLIPMIQNASLSALDDMMEGLPGDGDGDDASE